MLNNWDKLLPDWKIPPQTIAIILLKSQFDLNLETNLINQEKDRLLHYFLTLGETLKRVNHPHLTEVISPKDGTPQYSRRGELIFDLVATVHHSLRFDFSRTVQGCKVLNHPLWGTAVYPGLFLSDAPISELQSIFVHQK
jgi:hypothetical protein